MFKRFIAVMACVFVAGSAFSQIRQIPDKVRENFANKYPNAQNIEFKDKLVSVNIHFTIDSENYIASFNNDGDWKETERAYDFEKLSADVKDGFEKSKYADWKVIETGIIYKPGDLEEYRLKVEKSDLQKKYLFFNPKGRLKRDSITL
jgi:hypothetical protein